MKIYSAILIGLFVTVAAQPAYTQDKPNKPERKAALKDLRSNMRTWFEADVLPSLTTWHQDYDASLTSQDLATLNRYRAEAKQLKTAMKADIRQLHATAERGNRDVMKEKMQAVREKYHASMKNIAEGVKPIAKGSREKLRSLFDTNEDQIDAWRNKAREIMKQWKTENPDMDHHGKSGKGLPIIGEDGKRAALRFILWDGMMPSADDDMMGDDMRITVSPAPSGNAATINVTNVPNGPAKLEVYDMNGTLVRSINVSASNGTIDQRVDLSGLVSGTYMASVSTPEGRRTGQIIVRH